MREMGKTFRLPHEEARKRFAKLPYFRFVRGAYLASHSWLLAGIASIVVYFAAPSFAAPFAFGVFLHLAMDLFVHKGGVGGQVPFYPVSMYRVVGFVHWSDRAFLAANYALLILVYALIWAHVL